MLRLFSLICLSFFLVFGPIPLAHAQGRERQDTEPARESVEVEEDDLTSVLSKTSIFHKITHLLEDGHIDGDALDARTLNAMFDEAISAFVERFGDPHTRYLSKQDKRAEEEQKRGKYTGIGTRSLDRDNDGNVTIFQVFPGGPAEEADLEKGDIIVAVNDVPITSPEQLGKLIKGSTAEVSLIIRRESVTFTIALTPRVVERPALSRQVFGNVAYVWLFNFSQSNALEQFSEVVKQFETDQSINALIFDLRYNTGGSSGTARAIVNIFFTEKDSPLFFFEDKNGVRGEFRAYNPAVRFTKPVVVLVNGWSSSASEIVAGVLQEKGRALLIGRKTFGKGTVQRPILLANGAILMLTYRRWLLPSGRNIDGVGLSPDILVPEDVEFKDIGEEENDPDLQKALELLRDGGSE